MDDQLPGGNQPITQSSHQQQQTPSASQPTSSVIGGKEREAGMSTEGIVELPQEPETILSDEEKEAGVEVVPTEVELPPDIKRLGVSAGASAQPVIHQGGSQQSAALPLDDPQIVAGQKESVWSSIRWLAEWCLRQLKRTHTVLKVVQNKVLRVKYPS